MADIPGGMAFGPFDPNDPNAGDKVKKLIEAIHDKVEEVEDTQKMRGEARALQVRLFLESLDDEQLTTYRTLLGGLAAEGRNNYMTSIFYGMAIATEWARKPVGTEMDLGGVMAALDGAEAVMPIRPESVDIVGMEPTPDPPDDPDDAA